LPDFKCTLSLDDRRKILSFPGVFGEKQHTTNSL
jgi:hypothetical protein